MQKKRAVAILKAIRESDKNRKKTGTQLHPENSPKWLSEAIPRINSGYTVSQGDLDKLISAIRNGGISPRLKKTIRTAAESSHFGLLTFAGMADVIERLKDNKIAFNDDGTLALPEYTMVITYSNRSIIEDEKLEIRHDNSGL